METEDFVRQQNVLRFSERLKTENDPKTRKGLGRLLLEEENKFALTAEQLDKADNHIANCKTHIKRQYGVIDRLRMGGHDIGAAERLLRNLMELHDLFVGHRQTILAALDRRLPGH